MNKEQAYEKVFEYFEKDNPNQKDTYEYAECLKFLIDKVKDIYAMLNYGELCRIQKRYDIAMKYYEQVIQCKKLIYKPAVSRAYANIGLICKDKLSDYYDKEKAYSYFLISGYLGFTGGMYEVAKCYKEGFFVEKNQSKYYDYLKTICDIADEEEQELLVEAYYELALRDYKQQQIKKANERLTQAIELLKEVKENDLPDQTVVEKIYDLERKLNTIK